MVSYCNSLAMYRPQQQHPASGWYQSYQQHPAMPQQYLGNLSCVQDEQTVMPSWHHPAHGPHHSVFPPADWSPSTTPDYMHHHHHHHHQGLHEHAEPILPSPPMTVSDMSSPSGGTGGTVTPPQSSGPGSAGSAAARGPPPPTRSPFEWMKKPSYQSQPNPGEAGTEPMSKTRTKDKYRVVYSDHQRLELEKEFHYSRYITIRRKAELAASLGLSERQVKIWFQNRRAKERKQTKKREELDHKVKLEDLQPGAPIHQGLTGVPGLTHQAHHQHHSHHLHHQLHHHQLHHPHHPHHPGATTPTTTSPLPLPLPHAHGGGTGHAGVHAGLVHHHMLAVAGGTTSMATSLTTPSMAAAQLSSSGSSGAGGGGPSGGPNGGGSLASPTSNNSAGSHSGSHSGSSAASRTSSGGGAVM